jgi:hypothetical protein
VITSPKRNIYSTIYMVNNTRRRRRRRRRRRVVAKRKTR